MIILLFAASLVACNEKPETKVATPAKAAVSEKVSAVESDNGEDGAALHAEKCVSCHVVEHNAAFYQREDRKMHSYVGLQKQVVFCDAQLGLGLFEEEATAIGDYLNDSFYKFKK